jgi:hypothetical protein
MATPELGSQVPFFLNTFLSKPASALPKGAQWVLVFEGSYITAEDRLIPINSIVPITAIKRGVQFEPKQWDIEGGLNTIVTKDYQQTKGCLFAQAVQIPGESTVANPEGIQMNGFIRTFSGGGRNSFANLQISFLETNVSFVDNVLRPWTIATAHLGLIARSGADNYRCNISVYKLGVISPNQPPYVACKYTFFGACPIEVTGEEYNYTQTTSPVNREATFIYHYYTVATGIGNSAIKNNTIQPIPLSTRNKNINVVNQSRGT